MRHFPQYIIVLLILVFPSEARLGRVHLQRIALSSVVERSTKIVIAKRKTKTPKGKKVKFAKIEPFNFFNYRYEVVEQLFPNEKMPAKEVVLTSFDDRSLQLHVDYYAKGLRRSPIVAVYESEQQPNIDAQDAVILFLQQKAFVELRRNKLVEVVRGYGLTCDGAMETVSKKPQVLALLKQKSRPSAEKLTVTVGIRKKKVTDALERKIERSLGKKYSSAHSMSWDTIVLE